MKKVVVIVVALLMSLTLLAQKLVGTVVVRNEDGSIKECYSGVTINSYEETEEGVLTKVDFTTRGGKNYILCGLIMTIENATYVETRPRVVYVEPSYYSYSYRSYVYRPYSYVRPYVRPLPPVRPYYHTGPGAPPRYQPFSRPPQHYHPSTRPLQHHHPGYTHCRPHTGPGAPPRSQPRGRRY